ncbi:MAG: radical SAM protein [Myxococcota bacterium]
MSNTYDQVQQHNRPATTAKQQHSINQEFDRLSKSKQLLPIKVSSFFKKKIAKELAVLQHTQGPLHRMVYPSRDKLSLRAPGEVRDFVDDRSNMPAGIANTIIQKYHNRILFLPTSVCAAHCQYCFRQDILSEQHINPIRALDQKLEQLQHYVQQRPHIEEVILSGGDPMTLPLAALDKIITCIQQQPSIDAIRIHTKTISYAPQVFGNEAKLKLLAHAGVRMVFHLVHPYEICDEVHEAIAKIRRHGIRCYNQFPILRHINDHPRVLMQLLKKLDEIDVRNLSIFVPEPVHYSAAFRIHWQRLEQIMDELNWHSCSWINSTRFVLDTPIGKVRRENLIDYDKKNGVVLFERDGKRVQYPDLPEHLDTPGDLKTMLWQDAVN